LEENDLLKQNSKAAKSKDPLAEKVTSTNKKLKDDY
jgi:hypothetical protein